MFVECPTKVPIKKEFSTILIGFHKLKNYKSLNQQLGIQYLFKQLNAQPNDSKPPHILQRYRTCECTLKVFSNAVGNIFLIYRNGHLHNVRFCSQGKCIPSHLLLPTYQNAHLNPIFCKKKWPISGASFCFIFAFFFTRQKMLRKSCR